MHRFKAIGVASAARALLAFVVLLVGLLSLTETTPQTQEVTTPTCTAARAALCDACGAESLLCEDCSRADTLVCEATPISPERAIVCDEVLAALAEAEASDPGGDRSALCADGEASLLRNYRVPRACQLADQLFCQRCGLLSCLTGRDADELAPVYGTTCEYLVLVLRQPESYGVTPDALCQMLGDR